MGRSMYNEYFNHIAFGIPYFIVLAVGVWLCVLRYPRSPRAYSLTGKALFVALVAWFAQPLVTDWPEPLLLTYPDSRELMYDSFIASTLHAVPIGLLIFVIVRSLRMAAASDEQAGAILNFQIPYRWVFLGGTVLLVLTVRLLSEFENYRYALVGAAPYLFLLAAGAWICLRQCGTTAGAGRIAGIALLLALLTWFVRPWLATWIHLRFYERTPNDFDGFYYEEPHILAIISGVVSVLCDALPIGLLVLAVFRLPESPSMGSRIGVDRIVPILAALGWGLLGGAL